MLLWLTTAGNIIDSALKYNILILKHPHIHHKASVPHWLAYTYRLPLHFFFFLKYIFPDALVLVKGCVAALDGGKVELRQGKLGD